MKNQKPDKSELLAVYSRSKDIHDVAKHYGVGWSTVRCWVRWLNIDFRPSKEGLLIDSRSMTDVELAKKYKVSNKTILVWRKEYGISKKELKLAELPSNLSALQLSVIEGKLLGDGWIEKIQSSKSNTCFGIEHGLLQEEYLIGVNEILHPYSLPVRYRTRKNPFKEKAEHSNYIKSCLFNTRRHVIFNRLREKWYPNGKKLVPRDLNLNWQSVAIWYCDDGSNILGHKCVRRNGVLCTNSFAKEDVEFLVEQLHILGVRSSIYSCYTQPVISILKEDFMYFIESIKPFVNWSCMQYKLAENAG